MEVNIYERGLHCVQHVERMLGQTPQYKRFVALITSTELLLFCTQDN